MGDISSNTLFHFTKKEHLIDILKEGAFFPRYVEENFEYLFSDHRTKVNIPMTCFCDIPLSLTKEHTRTYQKYAIGLTKEWGKSNKISPVMYFHRDAATVTLFKSIEGKIHSIYENTDLEKIIKNSHGLTEKEKEDKILAVIGAKMHFTLENIKLYSNFIQLVKYFKVDSGVNKESGIVENYYNEREWRYIPDIGNAEIQFFDSTFYNLLEDKKRNELNEKIARDFPLRFTPHDIRFIIVEKEEEIAEMLEEISKITWKSGLSDKGMQVLKTRIISMEQIINDL